LLGLVGDDLRAAVVIAVLRGVADGVAHVVEPALVDQVDDELHLVQALEIGDFRLVPGLHQRVEPCFDEVGDAAAQHRLLAEEVGLRYLKREISGIKVAPYYGCHVLAPNEVALDDPDNPTLLKEILEPLGVEVIDEYQNQNTCCGYHATYTDNAQKERLAIKPLDGAKKAGADIVATPCPLCHKAMDGKEEPILQVTQLINVACGMTPEETAINLNKTEVKLSI
jgi:heterodisulfide reductase subunit B